MRYGFKSLAERIAHAEREAVGLRTIDRLDPFKFVAQKGVVVWFPKDIVSLSDDAIAQLTEVDPNSWSGISLTEVGITAIILNSAHGSKRHNSTLMHEWAHLHLGHKPNRIDKLGTELLLLSSYPKEFEDEADWLSGALLLPRDGVLHFRSRGFEIPEIAKHFDVSEEMARWRVSATGVDRQLNARRGSRASK